MSNICESMWLLYIFCPKVIAHQVLAANLKGKLSILGKVSATNMMDDDVPGMLCLRDKLTHLMPSLQCFIEKAVLSSISAHPKTQQKQGKGPVFSG